MNQKQKFTEAEIKAVCVARQVSPARAVELLEAAAWHKAVADSRQPKSKVEVEAPKPAAPST